MEAVAGRSCEGPGDEPGERPLGGAHGPDLLARLASLAYRLIEVDEATVLVRAGRRSESLVEAARAGGSGLLAGRGPRAENVAVRRALNSGNAVAETGRGRRLSAAAPLTVAGDVRGVLAVVAVGRGRPLAPNQLQLLGELADLGGGLLEERDLRAQAETIIAAGIDVLAHAVDIRDDYTGRHSAQVGDLARRVGIRLGMSPEELELLERAARLHDVGKLAIPDTILQKPGPLDEAEWEVMRRHVEIGAEMVGSVPGLEPLGEVVGHHHERWDGHGYPRRIEGDAIPLASRVISVCDAFEAMVSDRPYRASLNVATALAELLAGAGSQFDPAVVAAVVELEMQTA